MKAVVAGKEVVIIDRQELAECIYDAFSPGVNFTTKDAVAACREGSDILDDCDATKAWEYVFGVLGWLWSLRILEKTQTGWRL